MAEKLSRHYRTNIYNTWDQMHLAGTVDTAMRNPKKDHARKFAWLRRFERGLKIDHPGQSVPYVAGGSFRTICRFGGS